MIRALILYYLSIKPTHGYEIQKFIQLSGTDQWMKIQSGSIYYALTKLEKEKCIDVLREERTGSRVRKIYKITEHGMKEMHKEIMSVLQTPIAGTGSPKFIIEPMLSLLDESELKVAIQNHIKELEEKREYWKRWSDIKAGKDATKLVQLSFSMTINALEDQILWHKELLDNLELYLNEGDAMKNFIIQFDVDSDETEVEVSEVDQKISYLNKIKDIIKDNPSKALDNLDLILEELQRQKS
ncbi:Transcriptional regulator PadR-like family protein [Anaerosporobacter mobilis DSM 15930]|jgi:DNA-binding PadR family transcriptional regulator|uniref:Transcriptional regulator PadR-like family protein n=1 Tax=Anaerosporobacter mobilis DSM 15930 TaxID=1120996 RepID=A0A1M7G2R8_9FIRM|nr:PadR family transcriptional regulator [Anaerosporobacter mobilis]SHM10455.1 Transcriptional regulator PadR-like family protein [Anaerosporobacter mobilis DSM 15930]